MSYKEAFQHYYMKNYIEGLIEDLGPLGLKPPRFLKNMIDENEVYSHAIWKNLYEGRDANIHKVEIPDAAERAWFTEKYPLFKKLYEPFWEAADDGEPLQLNTTFLHCKVCQFPMLFVDADNQPVVHAQTHNDKQHYFCSEPCKWIFNLEPDKYTRVFTQDEIFAQGIVEADDLTNFWAVGRADNGQLKRD
jgi:phenol hydroxylase P3 protein